nr:VCBS repeat-containing protein [Methylovulum psychrotolerans]
MTEQGDLNNDGKPDLVTVSEIPTYGQLGVSLGNGDGTFAAPTRYSAGAMPRNLQIGDLNRDGKADVLVTDDFREYVHIFLGNGSGSLTAQPDFLINATGSTATHATGVNLLALGDLNNDGKLDAAISIETQDSSKTTHYFIRLLLGNGDGTLTAKAGDISAREPAYQGTLKLAQLNADAHLDMLQGNADGTVSVWLGQGNGNFTANGTYTASSSDTLISVADINADNRADLVATNYAGSAISVFLGTGNGSFLGKIDYSIDSHPTGVEISDFNRDGKPDLAAITFFGAIAIFSNGMP